MVKRFSVRKENINLCIHQFFLFSFFFFLLVSVISAAVVLRLAKSWFRIGSLEILTKNKELDLLK